MNTSAHWNIYNPSPRFSAKSNKYIVQNLIMRVTNFRTLLKFIFFCYLEVEKRVSYYKTNEVNLLPITKACSMNSASFFLLFDKILS